MKYIKPHYYDAFVCLAGSCPATCCAGWQIVIDEESLDRYGNVKGDFGSRLRNSIDWMAGTFCQDDGRCRRKLGRRGCAAPAGCTPGMWRSLRI